MGEARPAPEWIRYLACLFLFFPAVTTASQTASDLEYRVKAAQIYWFARFVTWPPEAFAAAQSELVLCVLGRDPFGAALDTIAGKDVEGRKLTIRHVTSPDQLDPCHILFVSDSVRDEWPRIRETLKSRPLLTVADFEGFARSGGVFNFIRVENTVRFEINLPAAQQANLKISSRILRSAKTILQETPTS